MSDVRPLEVTEEMCVCALAAVYNFKRTRYGLLPLSLENIKASEGTHWALLMEETLVALQAALAVSPRDKGEPRASALEVKEWGDAIYRARELSRSPSPPVSELKASIKGLLNAFDLYVYDEKRMKERFAVTPYAPDCVSPQCPHYQSQRETSPPSQDTDNELAGNGMGMR